MSARIVLRAKCNTSRHTLATVWATPDGLVVDLVYSVREKWPAARGFRLQRGRYRLDGPADDPETWTTVCGCACEREFEVTSAGLRDAMGAGQKVVVLTAIADERHPERGSG